MSQNRDVSIPLKDEVRSVESSTMGDDTREFLVEDSEPVDSITGLTEDSLDILKPLVTTSVPIFKTSGPSTAQLSDEKRMDNVRGEDLYGKKTYVEKVHEDKREAEESATTLPWNTENKVLEGGKLSKWLTF